MSQIRTTHYGEPAERPVKASHANPATSAAIEQHVTRYLGEPATVLHEFWADQVHLDVFVVPATEDRPYQALVTCGMSDHPMSIPAELADEVSRYAEMVMLLPPDWPIGADDSPSGWPVFWLKHLARFPDAYDTWLGYWHGMPNGQPAEPLGEGTAFTGVAILPPIVPPEGFRELTMPDGREVLFLAVVPLLPDELAAKLADGIDALLPGFEAHGVNELLQPQRGSVLT